jgi:hypothetical protein
MKKLEMNQMELLNGGRWRCWGWIAAAVGSALIGVPEASVLSLVNYGSCRGWYYEADGDNTCETC